MKVSLKTTAHSIVACAVMLGAGAFTGSSVSIVAPAKASTYGIRVPSNLCFWENVDWSEMTLNEQQTWRVLGWNEARWDSYDESGYPASTSKEWSELSPSEQKALTRLGYTEKTWNEFDAETC